jgi:16S rRNA A1518/A1519 N6-dimethyltransferase RsmA/KsgA/DIM1 with predicted DNA glycosylase/AP lyase activity
MTVQEFVNIDKDLQTVQDISDVNIIILIYLFIKHVFIVQCSLVKPPPSVQSVVWRYNEFGDKLRDIENRKLCDHMKR